MVAVAVLVSTTDRRAPLRISIVRAQICDHDYDALASNTTQTTGRTRRLSRRSQVVAFAATRATP